MDNSTPTPALIDTRLAEIYTEQDRLNNEFHAAYKTVQRIDEVQGTYEANYHWNSPEERAKAVEVIDRVRLCLVALEDEARPLEQAYAEQRWTRYYLVTNAGGHVHSSTLCDTCFPTTRYAWLTEQSGMTAEDLVEMAGEMACTVCFPWAPVDVLQRKGTLEAPERKKAREDRERKRAEKDAAKIVVEGMLGWTNEGGGKHIYPTTRGATNAIAGWLKSLCWYGAGHPSAVEWALNIKTVRDALEAKGIDYDYDKALAAARKKVVRDGLTEARF